MRYWVRTLKIRDAMEPHQLKEIATVVHDGLQLLGLQAYHIRQGWPCVGDLKDERQIIIGGNVGTKQTLMGIPDNSIVYNFEQVGNFHFSAMYLELLRRCEVWDYNHINIERLKKYAINARYVPFGYVPSLTEEYRPQWDTEEYDVMFVGSMCSDVRVKIIEQLRHRKLNVFTSEACYGHARAEAYQRSKIVLNMHFHKEKIMESVRVGTAMANRKPVVCQMDVDTSADAFLAPGMACVPYDMLAETCERLAHDGEARNKLARLGFEIFSARKMDEILRPILNEPQRPVALPQSYEREKNTGAVTYRRISGTSPIR
jgi:hypothetical protein